MPLVAALYTSGKLVTGLNHGEAFGKLNRSEQNSEIQSGYIDQNSLKFISDDCEFYMKKIILMRHGDSEGEAESGITQKGQHQTEQVSAFFNSLNLTGYTGFSSPYPRCIETANLIEKLCQIKFSVNQECKKQDNLECNEDFFFRVKNVLHKLPEKSLIISHCDFIKVMTKLSNNNADLPDTIPNCSTTYIENHEVIWFAKQS